MAGHGRWRGWPPFPAIEAPFKGSGGVEGRNEIPQSIENPGLESVDFWEISRVLRRERKEAAETLGWDPCRVIVCASCEGGALGRPGGPVGWGGDLGERKKKSRRRREREREKGDKVRRKGGLWHGRRERGRTLGRLGLKGGGIIFGKKST